MIRSEKGNVYINWAVAVVVAIIFIGIVIKVLVGPTGLIEQRKEQKARKELERNIMIELTNEIVY